MLELILKLTEDTKPFLHTDAHLVVMEMPSAFQSEDGSLSAGFWGDD